MVSGKSWLDVLFKMEMPVFKVIQTLFCALPLLLVSSCGENAKGEQNTYDEQNSKDLLTFKNFAKEFTNAWNQHDSKALADLWTIDGDLLSPWTQTDLIKGREAIKKYFFDEYQEIMKDSTLEANIDNFRMIDSETAFVDVDFTLSGMSIEGIPAEPFNNHAVFVLVQKEGKWKIQVARPY